MRCGQIMVKCREISLWIYPQGNNIGMHAPFPRAVDACAVRYVVWLYWTSVLTSCVHQYTVHVVGYSSVDILVAYTVVHNSLPQCAFCWQWQGEIFFHEVELLPTPRDLMLTSRVLPVLSLWHYSALWSLFLRFLTDTLPLSLLYVVQISVTVTNNN